MTRSSSHVLLALGLLAMSCASHPKPRAEAPPRVKDSAAEKSAAHRGASRGLHLEEDEQRWGIAAAEERERDKKQKKAPGTTSSGSGSVDVTPPAPPPAPPR